MNVFTVSACGGRKPQLWGSCTGPLLPMRVTFAVIKQTKRQILSECVHSVGFRWPKPQFLANFDFCGRLDQFILSPSGGENSQFLPFFGLRHLVMSTVGCNLRKLNTGAQLQTFPYPTASKSFLFSNVFMAKSDEETLTFISVMDRQSVTDKKA